MMCGCGSALGTDHLEEGFACASSGSIEPTAATEGVGRVYGVLSSRRAATVSAAIVVVLLAGLAVAAMATATEPGPMNWPKNASGQTYGSGLRATSPADEPDLILVEATNGRIGYALRTDLEDPDPSTPEEAVRLQSARGGRSREIPVYLVDGRTKVGVFLIGYPSPVIKR